MPVLQRRSAVACAGWPAPLSRAPRPRRRGSGHAAPRTCGGRPGPPSSPAPGLEAERSRARRPRQHLAPVGQEVRLCGPAVADGAGLVEYIDDRAEFPMPSRSSWKRDSNIRVSLPRRRSQVNSCQPLTATIPDVSIRTRVPSASWSEVKRTTKSTSSPIRNRAISKVSATSSGCWSFPPPPRSRGAGRRLGRAGHPSITVRVGAAGCDR